MSSISPVNSSLPLQSLADITSQTSSPTATSQAQSSSYFNPTDTVSLSSEAQTLLAAASGTAAQTTPASAASANGTTAVHHHHHVDADAATQPTADTSTSATQAASLFSPVQATSSTDPNALLLSLLSQPGTAATE